MSFAWAYLICDERELRITKWKILAHSGIRNGTFRLRSERAKRSTIRADEYRSHKVDRILPERAINSYLYRVVDVITCFVVLNILMTLYSQETS